MDVSINTDLKLYIDKGVAVTANAEFYGYFTDAPTCYFDIPPEVKYIGFVGGDDTSEFATVKCPPQISLQPGAIGCRFYGLFGFNSAVTIPDANFEVEFAICRDFNRSIAIPSGYNCSGMFVGCLSLNSPIDIPSDATNCSRMFDRCLSFNQPISLPESGCDVDHILSYCESFNQPLIIPNAYVVDLGNNQLGYKPNTGITLFMGACSNYKSTITTPGPLASFGLDAHEGTNGAKVVSTSEGRQQTVTNVNGTYMWVESNVE